jgi:hypothetical protein
MATLQEKLDQARRGEISPEGMTKLTGLITSGKLDAIAQTEGIDLGEFKASQGVETVQAPSAMTKTAQFAAEKGVDLSPATAEKAQIIGETGTLTQPIGTDQSPTPEPNLSQKIASATTLEGSAIGQALADGSETPFRSGFKDVAINNPISQAVIGAGKEALDISVTGGRKIEEILGIEPIRDKIQNPETLAEFDRMNAEFEKTLEREGFSQKAGALMFDLGAIYAGGVGGRTFGTALGVESLAVAGAPALLALESAGATTAATLTMKDELPTKAELGGGYLIDLALTKALHLPVSTKAAAEWAKSIFKSDEVGEGLIRAGLDTPQANIIKDVPPELKGFAEQYLEQATKRSNKIFEFGADGGKVKTATDLVADDIKATQDAMAGFLKTTGEEIGVISDGLKGKGVVSTKGAMESFIANLDELNVTVSLDKVVPSGSDVSGIAADEALLQDAYDFLKSNELVNPRDLLSKIRNYGNKLFAGRGDITASKRPIQALREDLMTALGGADEAYAPLAKQYSMLLDTTDTLNKTVRESGENAAQYMRRLFSRSSGKAESVVEMIENVSKEFDITAGKNTSGKAIIATTLDDISGVTPPQGLQGQAAQAGEKVLQKGVIRGGVETALNKISEVLFDSPSKLEAVEAFMKQIDGATPTKLSSLDKLIKATQDPALKTLLMSVRAAMQSST